MESEESENPFRSWLEHAEELHESFTVYLPNRNAVRELFQKTDLKLWQFDKAKMYDRYYDVQEAFLYLWSDETKFIEKDDGDSVDYEGTDYKITSVERIGESVRTGLIKVRYISGWIGHPYLGKYLLRLLKGDSENGNNPFNEFKGRTKLLPDISYLPELYEILGVKDFDDIRLGGAIDWNKMGKGLQIVMTYDHHTEITFSIDNYERESIPILWEDMEPKTYYLQRLPKVVIDRLKDFVTMNRNTIPKEQWSKDSFQLISDRLKGKDLISLCNTDVKFNSYCNVNDQELFRRRLISEFGIDWLVTPHGFNTPRELYIQLYDRVVVVVKDSGNESHHSKQYRNGEIPESAIVVLVPGPDMPTIERNNFSPIYTIFFPDAPELSFIAVCNKNVHGEWKCREVYDTKPVELFLKTKEQVRDFVEQVLNRRYNRWFNESKFNWLVELTGDSRTYLLLIEG